MLRVELRLDFSVFFTANEDVLVVEFDITFECLLNSQAARNASFNFIRRQTFPQLIYESLEELSLATEIDTGNLLLCNLSIQPQGENVRRKLFQFPPNCNFTRTNSNQYLIRKRKWKGKCDSIVIALPSTWTSNDNKKIVHCNLEQAKRALEWNFVEISPRRLLAFNSENIFPANYWFCNSARANLMLHFN